MIKHDFMIYLMKECVHIHPLINDICTHSNYLLIEHTLSQVKVTSQSLILARLLLHDYYCSFWIFVWFRFYEMKVGPKNGLLWFGCCYHKKENSIFRPMASHKNVRQLLCLYSYPMAHLTKSYIEFPNGITVGDGARSSNTIELYM